MLDAIPVRRSDLTDGSPEEAHRLPGRERHAQDPPSPSAAQRRRRTGISTPATARCMIPRAALVDAVVPATRGRLNDTSKTPIATAVQIVRAREVNFSSTTREAKPSNEPVKLPITTSSIPMVWGAPFPN